MSRPRANKPVERVAIFGATSQIAADIARAYAKRGARLFLVARNADKLAALCAELGAQVAGSYVQDLDRTQEAQACVQGAIAALGELDVALLAQGLLGDQLQSERELETAEQITATNYASVIALVIPLANQMEAQRHGHLAVLSTVAADRGRPRNYTYAAAKSAVNTYMQGVRSRLFAAGVQIHTIKLGPTDTPMTTSHEKTALFARSPDVARWTLAAIDRGDFEAYVPPYWRYIMLVVRNLPEGVFQRFSSLSGR